MRLLRIPEAFDRPDFIFEPKLDGFRALVVARTREIGIRVALGARPLRVMSLVLTEVGLMTAIGLAVGIAGGFAGSRFIISLLYQVQPSDVTSVALPLISILVTAGLSALIPALRAVQVDPMKSLRSE